jgi:aminoglycoside phosphotransferase family enzyme/predicted kinase
MFEAARLAPDTVETHISTIVFTGDLVHKRKKAVHFPFVDLSTPELREQICHREVDLNRRFSPDVYLGVEDIVDERGKVVDHAVVMRRMPPDRRLSTLVRQHCDVSDCLSGIARAMAACHAEAPRSEAISAVATPAALQQLWSQNMRELAPFAPWPLDRATLERAEQLALRYIDGRGTLLAERISNGRIVDGHGDLLADDIFCLDDHPRILDCLEFDDHLRWGDVLYDVGFLAMDFEHLGRPDLASEFFDRYAEFAGEVHPPSLEHHYVGYRALVRAKISCLRNNATEARHYLAQCLRHLRVARVQLVVIGGLPGTGKSTLASALGDELGWTVLRTDEMRKELAGIDSRQRAADAYGAGLYEPTMTDDTYRAVLSRARTLLERGWSVIIDASFSSERWRAEARTLAASTSSDLSEFRCVLPAAVAADRLIRRLAESDDSSDATPAIATEMAHHFDRWPSALTVGTLPPVDDIVPTVLEHITLDASAHDSSTAVTSP